MSGWRHEDYLMRQVRAVAAALARIAGLRRQGLTEEAAVALEDAYGELLGPQADLVRHFDAATAATLVAAPERILALARLCREEAALHDDPDQRTYLLQRARDLAAEAARRAPDDPDIAAFLADEAPTEG